MALVKKSKIKSARVATAAVAAKQTLPGKVVQQSSSSINAVMRDEQVSERIAAATEELASGLAQSAAATKQLGRSMEHIAAGAEQAASASQEQSAALKAVVAGLGNARTEAERSSRQTKAMSDSLRETSAQILRSVQSIERGAKRQGEVVAIISVVDQRAKDIGEITRAVSRISDQTNLLALNAAIEAARAGAEGRGFAVVADEVRALASTSDKNAKEVQALAESILNDVTEVTAALKRSAEVAKRDVKSAAGVAQVLEARRDDMKKIAEGSGNIQLAVVDAERSAVEARKGAEQVASAALEQSSGAAEAQSSIEQQAKALDQSQQAAQALAAVAEQIRSGRATAKMVDTVGASAEQLSASIQQLSNSASQVMAAVSQISRAAQLQTSSTHQTTAALGEIENVVRETKKNALLANERVMAMDMALKDGRQSVEQLVNSVSDALADNQASVITARRLELVGRKIEKIVDAIALIGVQTSMLAVNGSVEAARAGEAGRGFAVVSSDIRALSRDASDNVERAKDTVRGILDQIAVLKSSLDQFIVSAEVEAQNNRSVSTALQRMEGMIASLGIASNSILTGADEILTATTEMGKAARQIATAAEEASAGAREAATAATEQSRGAEDLAAAIEEVAALAGELKRQPA